MRGSVCSIRADYPLAGMKKVIEWLLSWIEGEHERSECVREDMGYGERIEPVVAAEDDHTW